MNSQSMIAATLLESSRRTLPARRSSQYSRKEPALGGAGDEIALMVLDIESSRHRVLMFNIFDD